MRRLVIWIAAVAVVVLLAGVGGYGYYLTYSPDRTRFPVRGIDVSRHQGTIDWARVAADDVTFAIIKASEGGDFVDTEYAKNVAGARAAGVTVGAYHFFTLCRPGAEQAANFLAQIDDPASMLPPVVDLEYTGNCDARPNSATLRAELEAFLAPVEAAFGRQAILYMIYDFYDDHSAGLPKRPLWTRWIAWEPRTSDWLLWQYHNAGRVDGIVGDVDLNVLNGNADLADLMNG